MFNISEETKVTNVSGVNISHIQQCLDDSTMHEKPKYHYFGKDSSKGEIVLNSCKGDLLLTFEEHKGWADIIIIETI